MLLLVSLALAIYYLLASIYFAIAIAFAAKAAPTKKKPLCSVPAKLCGEIAFALAVAFFLTSVPSVTSVV